MRTEFVAPRFDDSPNQVIGCSNGGAPAACGGYLEDIVRGGGAHTFSNMGRRAFGDGPSIQRINYYGHGGQFLGSSSRILMPGESGWDGSADGTHRMTPSEYAAYIKSKRAAATRGDEHTGPPRPAQTPVAASDLLSSGACVQSRR